MLRQPTLTQVVIPQTGLVRDALVVMLFCGFIALSAQITIKLPFTTVPITGQTLGVLLTGAALGGRLGAVTLLLYVAVGSLGFPVYADGKAGAFWGLTSGGYLVGFVVAAWLVGMLAERGWDRRPHVLMLMVAGNLVIYLFGVTWLGLFIAGSETLQNFIPGGSVLEKALNGGLFPFIPGDILKIIVAAGVLPSAWKMANRGR